MSLTRRARYRFRDALQWVSRVPQATQAPRPQRAPFNLTEFALTLGSLAHTLRTSGQDGPDTTQGDTPDDTDLTIRDR